MKHSSRWLGLLLLAAGPLSAAQPFAGTMERRIAVVGRFSQVARLQVKEGYARVEGELPTGQTVSIIIDYRNRQFISLLPGQYFYLTGPFPDNVSGRASSAAASGTLSHRVGETRIILGYPCSEYTYQGNGPRADIWATDAVGGWDPQNLGGLGSGVIPPWARALSRRGLCPLLITGKLPSGDSFSMKMISIDRRFLPDSTFQPPEGAHPINMDNLSGMLQGLLR